MAKLRMAGVALVSLALWGSVTVPPTAAAVVKPAVPWDINGDGYAELALGAPNETVTFGRPAELRRRTGVVTLLKGSPGGPVATGSVTISQDTAGVVGYSETGDQFGSGLASCDLNRDGYADLAIGAVGETGPGDPDANRGPQGAVSVLYGSASGVRSSGNDLLGPAEFGLRRIWGHAIDCGDINGDGYADLVLGGPGSRNQGTSGVSVFFGSRSGLAGGRVVHLEGPWGSTLAVGDLNGDGRDDLAVGGNDLVVFGGSPGGVRQPEQPIRISDTGLDLPRGGLGVSALAIGDFDGNSYADLAASTNDVPSVKCLVTDEETVCPGGVVVVSSSRAGLDVAGAKLWSADTSGVAGVGGPGDGFGAALAAGDLNRDGREDLAIGVPDKSVVESRATGGVTMLYGAPGGLTATRSQIWTQDSPRVPGVNESYDAFGSALLISALRGGTGNGLTIAIPAESVGTSRPLAGAALVLFGISGGVTASRSQLWTQSSPGVPGAAESGDCFGYPRAGVPLRDALQRC